MTTQNGDIRADEGVIQEASAMRALGRSLGPVRTWREEPKSTVKFDMCPGMSADLSLRKL